MPLAIEDYGLISDCHAAALVGRDGSIDWLCLPAFDSGACFAALLGTPQHGRWLIAPEAKVQRVQRRYRPGTLILETEFETETGKVRLVDCMAMGGARRRVLRIVEGLHGQVAMQMELIVRFDYGSITPWIRLHDKNVCATAGPDTVQLHADTPLREDHKTIQSEFIVAAGQSARFVLTYYPSHEGASPAVDADSTLAQTQHWWKSWSSRSTYKGRWHEAVTRSLLTLKALNFAPSGGIVAAPTTSLPEQAGGVRNWDYRYCWLRDSTFTLNALLLAGYREEAAAWRLWLLRAAAGEPSDLQILYGITGSRRLDEHELHWLPGYQGAAPVRSGNAAVNQFQLDVFGEVMDTLHLARAAGINQDAEAWHIQRQLLDFLVDHWDKPDEGIWEVRGPRRHFVHSKVMAWVAFDRAVKAAETFGLDGPIDQWRNVRDSIHAQVCSAGFDAARQTFVQSYGAKHLDASLLLIPLVGFLPADDARVIGTMKAIESNLMADGLIQRYSTETGVDNLPPGEGSFLPCSFWFADNLLLTGRRAEAEALFERLLQLRNDLGLLSEEYDPHSKHMLGNFPQALTHTALINTARLLSIPHHEISNAKHSGERPAAVAKTHSGEKQPAAEGVPETGRRSS